MQRQQAQGDAASASTTHTMLHQAATCCLLLAPVNAASASTTHSMLHQAAACCLLLAPGECSLSFHDTQHASPGSSLLSAASIWCNAAVTCTHLQRRQADHSFLQHNAAAAPLPRQLHPPAGAVGHRSPSLQWKQHSCCIRAVTLSKPAQSAWAGKGPVQGEACIMVNYRTGPSDKIGSVPFRHSVTNCRTFEAAS